MHRRYALLPVLAELGTHESASLEAQIVERAHWPLQCGDIHAMELQSSTQPLVAGVGL